MDEVYLEHAGARLYARVRGEGGAIVLLHGGLANHEACWRFAAPLAERYRVITPDLRASGKSWWSGELTWDLLADDVAAWLRWLGVDRALVGGISFGAGCAVRVALRHPALVSALALLHPAYAGEERGLGPAQRAAMDAMHAAGARCVAEGMSAMFPLLEALPEAMRDRARAVMAGYDPASVATSTRFMASGAQPFAERELAGMMAPALVVPGIDAQHPPEVVDVYARGIGARCVVEATDDFADAIDRLARR
ncbi:MAG TPA: alpha/beta fold hydrolase [Kofleriaceae bacterium]|jgi:pimeloyl-ACP methyl ester carboxylesterase